MEKTKIFAAYLPQYHETEDNNRFWGKGYTDWTAVKTAKPMFEGHNQPRVPIENNYYNLLDPDVIKKQVELAKLYGISGFNIYHYWFKDGKQELERPAELLLSLKELDIEFFFTWDNNSWRRTWGNVEGNDWAPAFDGSLNCNSPATLVEFEYGAEEQWNKHFEYLLDFFYDDRYLKINNKPVFMFVCNTEPQILKAMGAHWDILAKKAGFDGLYLVTKKKNFFSRNLFDAVYNYEPETSAWGKRRAIDKRLNSTFKKKIKRDEPVKYNYDYDVVWKRIIKSAKKHVNNEIIGTFVQYDDTPRRGKDAMIVSGASPEKFGKWFGELYKFCCKKNVEFMLLTAWNEWGEGAYLEADTVCEYDYLRALKKVVESV